MAEGGWVRAGALAGSGVLRALCGVAAGGAKASLSVHFARNEGGSVADLNAVSAGLGVAAACCLCAAGNARRRPADAVAERRLAGDRHLVAWDAGMRSYLTC